MTKNVIVTGGTRGIGKAISVGLKSAGYQVSANYAGNEEAAAKFENETGIPIFKWDVADFEACESAIQEIEGKQGPTDVLVNNAGVTRDIPFHKMSIDHWRTVMSVDLDSAFNMTRPIINGMRDRSYGRIVNISSINGQKGQFGQANYSAAKAGLIGFSRALAQETARKGITVNAIAPGYIGTDMVNALDDKIIDGIVAQIPVGRLGTPEEIADCVAFLASEQAGFITGSVLTVNGGQYIAA